MSIKREYKACLFQNDQLIDETYIDVNNKEFALHLFKNEFGYENLNDTVYVTIEPMRFFDTETGENVEIEQVNREDRINPIDDMPQFKIIYPNGETTQIEARDLEEILSENQ